MANTFAPFGFKRYTPGSSGVSSIQIETAKISPSNSTPIYYGDPVIPATSTSTGYIIQGPNSNTTALAGIFLGCKYLSISQKRITQSMYWPGSDASGDVEAYLCADPTARFIVQTSGASFPITGSSSTQTSGVQRQYAQYTIGSGNSANGISGAYLSSVGTTNTLPFVVLDYVTFPPTQNGTDNTSQYCYVIVGFNNMIWRSNGAGPTGIS